ncbi:family 16 glycoside hydrolase [Microbulbifer agarilyticus]|uniref:family 16 glycoside hydrolase n=1 Tax=Microbulbifer agarilyticus TaxID=260552 RepID=UPI001CD1B808|nr:family 16 glycoside hydrolase [Microbulbifer agarilyticus]MCA0899129.1 hypothetical protein [Microbulbifer agarilyticus]
MKEIIGELAGTPLPTIMVCAGIIFLVLAVSGGVSGKLSIPDNRVKASGIIGGFLVAIGIFIYIVPTINISDAGGVNSDVGDIYNDSNGFSDRDADGFYPDHSSWNMVADDHFGADLNKWYLGQEFGEKGDYTSSIASGVLRVDYSTRTSTAYTVYSKYDPLSDFYAAIDVNFKGSYGSNDFSAGLAFRASKYTRYQVTISNNQKFKFEYYDEKAEPKYIDIISWTHAPVLNVNEKNRLAILASGGKLDVFANGKLVGSAFDRRKLSGMIGVYGEVYSDKPMTLTVDFDNFELRAPNFHNPIFQDES